MSRILSEVNAGDERAWDRLLPLVQEELRAVAGALMRNERHGHTLQPTALVHEAYVRLAAGQGPTWEGRSHFLAIAAHAMRRVLVDHARKRGAEKRGGAWRRVDLSDVAPASARQEDVDVLALHEALEELARLSERQSQVVELRYFGGMTLEEVGDHLGLTRSQAKGEWTIARAWLFDRLAS